MSGSAAVKAYIYIGTDKYSLGRVVRLSMDGRIDYKFDHGLPAVQGIGTKPEQRVLVPLFAPEATISMSMVFNCAEEGLGTFEQCFNYLLRRLDDDLTASVQGGRDFCVQFSGYKFLFGGGVMDFSFEFDQGRPLVASVKLAVKLGFFKLPVVEQGTC